MKKFVATLAILTASTAAFAGFQGSNAQQNNAQPTAAISSVAEAQKAADDSVVTLKGNIVAQLGKEKYTFKDQSGSITVEIDDDVWKGVDVDANTPVTLYGEVDRDRKGVEIDVKRISK